MKKNISTKITFIIFLIVFLVLPLANASAISVADNMKNALTKVDLPSGGDNADATAVAIVGNLIGSFISLLGVIFMVLMIYGGFKWMMARGQEEEIKSAQGIIRSAIIGLILILLAYTITYFVTLALQGSV